MHILKEIEITTDEEDPLKNFKGHLEIPLSWFLWWCMGRGAEWYNDSEEEETNRYKRKPKTND